MGDFIFLKNYGTWMIESSTMVIHLGGMSFYEIPGVFFTERKHRTTTS